MKKIEIKFLNQLLLSPRDNHWVHTSFTLGLAYNLAKRVLVENPLGTFNNSNTNLWSITEKGLSCLSAKESKMPSLKQRLASLLHHAIKNPHQNITVCLYRGLSISATYDPGRSCVDLVLSRDSVFPSGTEWYTILAHWPYPASSLPTRSANGQHSLFGSIPYS